MLGKKLQLNKKAVQLCFHSVSGQINFIYTTQTQCSSTIYIPRNPQHPSVFNFRKGNAHTHKYIIKQGGGGETEEGRFSQDGAACIYVCNMSIKSYGEQVSAIKKMQTVGDTAWVTCAFLSCYCLSSTHQFSFS